VAGFRQRKAIVTQALLQDHGAAGNAFSEGLHLGPGTIFLSASLALTASIAPSKRMFWGQSGEILPQPGILDLASSKFLTSRSVISASCDQYLGPVTITSRYGFIERLGFRFIGRQRQCHYIDGRPCDRLMFDCWQRAQSLRTTGGID